MPEHSCWKISAFLCFHYILSIHVAVIDALCWCVLEFGRCVYAQKKLSHAQTEMFHTLSDECHYVCGVNIIPDGNELHKVDQHISAMRKNVNACLGTYTIFHRLIQSLMLQQIILKAMVWIWLWLDRFVWNTYEYLYFIILTDRDHQHRYQLYQPSITTLLYIAVPFHTCMLFVWNQGTSSPHTRHIKRAVLQHQSCVWGVQRHGSVRENRQEG
jgi:hypothetical protein